MVKTLASSYSLPPNPEWISFPRTDANSSRWPKNNSRVILQDGTVNYFELLPIDHGQVVKWRIQVGAAVAERLGYVGFGALFRRGRLAVLLLKEGYVFICHAVPTTYRLLVWLYWRCLEWMN